MSDQQFAHLYQYRRSSTRDLPRGLGLGLGLVLTVAGCSDEPEPPPLSWEDGYSPGTPEACEPLRAALVAPTEQILFEAKREPGDQRTPLEAELTRRMIPFLEQQCYKLPGWQGEDGVHLTGSAEQGDTHGWVRVWYSPETYEWLQEGRPEGEVPDQAIIVKERFNLLADDKFSIAAWQPMIRRPADSADGWFWGELSQAEARHGEIECEPNDVGWDDQSFQQVADCRPTSGFGQPCLRCHSSAPGDLTYSQLDHLPEFTRGTIIDSQTVYSYREQWRQEDQDNADFNHDGYVNAEPAPFVPSHRDRVAFATPLEVASEDLVAWLFPADVPALESTPTPFPSRFFDHVVPPGGKADEASFFSTSDNCWSCHSGVPHVAKSTVNYGTNPVTLQRYDPVHQMLDEDVPFADGSDRYADVSPYGEWSMSMMGLAGKDPVFFAQHEWETDHRQDCAKEITNTCYGCHGVAGRRQLDIDSGGTRTFDHDMVYADAASADAKYGALARDGVTCVVCHRMSDENFATPSSYTGNFVRGSVDTIMGPYEDDAEPEVQQQPMEHSLGLTPTGEQSSILKSAALCGTCHAVKLPVKNVATCKDIGEGYEQATFLEWRNSDYRKNDDYILDEGASGADPNTCQDCHMPREFRDGDPLERKIASVEDSDFPDNSLEGLLPGVHDAAKLKPRRPFSRHGLVGINLFTLTMFQQFPYTLGIALFDYMTNEYGEPIALQMKTAIDNGTELAGRTAEIEIGKPMLDATDATVEVTVTNLAGHKFPTGVAFRRAILQVAVEDASGEILWISGRIDDSGLIVGADGRTALATELHATQYERHHQLITSEDQVQIYEERVTDSEGNLTTSFLGIAGHPKDNRLLPKGWQSNFAATMENGMTPDGLEPHGVEDDMGMLDPQYESPACGCDTIAYRIPIDVFNSGARVVARVYYQSLPPYYLRDRATLANSHSDALRLAQFVTHLNTTSTQDKPNPIAGWKLLVEESERAI